MSVQAHPRFLRRRTRVREHRARRHLRRALWILLLVAVVWALAWVAQSPPFSVSGIEVSGARNARVNEILLEQDVYPGRPLVLIRVGRVEDALASDPWVKEVSIRRRFPDRVEVQIVERVEVAAVPAATGWSTVSDDGWIMQSVPEPPDGLARITGEVARAAGGGEQVSSRVRAVVDFLSALPAEVMARTTISAAGNELLASIDAHQIRLGDPSNMAAKAAALVAVLGDSRLAPNALIDLIAPSRPAVSLPAPPAPPVDEAAPAP
ncbi:MAG: cell division protein FtsQ/DivIB [Acidimicrobiia bacterium]